MSATGPDGGRCRSRRPLVGVLATALGVTLAGCSGGSGTEGSEPSGGGEPVGATAAGSTGQATTGPTPDQAPQTTPPADAADPGGVGTTAPREPGDGMTSGHTGTWAGDPVSGDIGLDDDVPPQPHPFLWYLELPEDATRQPNPPAGYTIALLPSGCEFRAFQGSVSGEADPGVSDRVGTEQIGELLQSQFARDGVSGFTAIDPLTVSLNHDDGTLELEGMEASYSTGDAPWSSRTYYRGMPGSDSALFLTLSCAADAMDAGAADLDALLADSTVVPGP